MYDQQSFGMSSYKMVEVPHSPLAGMLEARKICGEYDSDVFVPNSRSEAEFIASLMSNMIKVCNGE